MIDCERCENCNEEEFFGEELEEDSAEFVINTDYLANWALKKIKEEDAEAERLKAIAMEEMEDLQRQITLIEERKDRRTGFLKSKLYDYFNKVDHKETKTTESYKLLDGSLVWKKPSLKMVPDKDKLLEYVKKHGMPEFVKVKEEVDWAKYKMECEIVDGKAVNVQTGDMLPPDIILVDEVKGSFDIK